jgi:antitoxin component of MazEF toxin-antitoxin module
MLAKLTSKNQITLPKAVIDQISVAEYFEVEAVNDSIMLTPVRMQAVSKGGTAADAVRQKLQELGITEQDIKDAVQWARAQPTP